MEGAAVDAHIPSILEDDVMQIVFRKSLIAVAICGASSIMANSLHAQAIDIGTLPGGSNCETTGVDSSGVIVGECIGGDSSGEKSEAIYTLSGQTSPSLLPTLATDKICNTEAIGENGTIGGDCDDADDIDQAVVWTPDSTGNYTTAPISLLPFQGGDNLPADVSAAAGPVNAQGIVIGTSTNSEGHAQAVIWNTGATTPTQLLNPSIADDESVEGCKPTAINDAASPVVVGFCTIQKSGNTRNVAVRWTISSGVYAATALDDLPGKECNVSDVNMTGNSVGTCADADGDPRAVYWAGSGSALIRLDANQGYGVSINDAGTVVIDKLTDDGYSRVFTGDPNALPLADIGTLPNGFNCTAVGEDESGDIAVNCDGQPGVSQASVYSKGGISSLYSSPSIANSIDRYSGEELFDASTDKGYTNGYAESKIKYIKALAAPRGMSTQPAASTLPSKSPAHAELLRTNAYGGGYGASSGNTPNYGDPSTRNVSWILNGTRQSSSNYQSFAFYQSKGKCTSSLISSGGRTGLLYNCTA